MMDTLPFSKLVEINPTVKLGKEENYPFVEMGIVEPGRRYVHSNQNRFFQGGGSKFLSGDILFARITPCLENGKIAQYIDDTGRPGFGSTEFFVFRARPGLPDPGFVYYIANSDLIRKSAEKSMAGASGRQRADLKLVMDIEVPAPPLPAQQRIASILSAYDDLIENNTRRIKILEEMAQRIYKEWFVDSELGRIPSGWRTGTLSEACVVVPGYAFKSKDWSESGVPVVKIKNIRPGRIVDIDEVDHVPLGLVSSRMSKFLLKNGDFLIAMTGATAGKVGKLRSNTNMLLNQRVAKLIPHTGYSDYLWCRISSEEAEKEFYRLADGAAQPNMSGSQIESVRLLIPELRILKSFTEAVSSMIQQVDTLRFKNKNLRLTRDLLLPKLISGEIDVSEMPDPMEAAAA